MSEEDRTGRVAETLRKLADIVDQNAELERFPQLFGSYGFGRIYSEHLVGDEAAQIDQFATAFSVDVIHRVHGEHAREPGARYSEVETSFDGVLFRFQARTEDYERATGKTVDDGGAR